ncbi:MAG TPA: response regulator, partial [Candidatus Wallbacteria bacterium]|nr:response regulator [Candidatus Wallbacteria bacterium]
MEEGYEVRPTSSGERALMAVQAQQPELIILDLRMPGMDGSPRRNRARGSW